MVDHLLNIKPRNLMPLGILGGIEVAVRGVGSTSLVDIVDAVSDGLLVAVVVLLSEGWIGQYIGELATWVLYAIVIYLLLPSLMPGSLSELLDDRVLMWLISICVVIIANGISTHLTVLRTVAATGQAIGGPEQSITNTYWILLLWCFITLSLYLWIVHPQPILGEGSPFSQTLRQIGGENITSDNIDSVESPTLYKFFSSFEVLTMIAALSMICLFLGSIVAFLSILYPIPEFLFIGASVITGVSRRIDPGPKRRYNIININFEKEFGKSLGTVLKTEKGFGIGLATFLVVFASTMMFVLGINGINVSTNRLGNGIEPGWTGTVPNILAPVAHYAVIGATVTLLVCSLCLLWGWFRVASRTQAFITSWKHQRENIPGSPPTPETSRPPYGMIIPFLLATSALPALSPKLYATDDYVLQTIYGFLWPIGLLIAVLWVRKTLQRTPQPSSTDSWVYGSSFILMFVWFGVLEPSNAFSNVRFLLFSIPFALYYVPDLKWRLQRFEFLPLEFTEESALLIVAFLFGLYSLLPSSPEISLIGTIGMLFVISLSLIYKIWYKKNSKPGTDRPVRKYKSEFVDIIGPSQVWIVERALHETNKQDVHEAFRNSCERWSRLMNIEGVKPLQEIGESPRPWLAIDITEVRCLTTIHDDLSVREKQFVITAIAKTLERAIESDVYFHEIQPENVWIRESDDALSVTIDDWGLSRECQVADGNCQSTSFSAPELINNPNPNQESEDTVVYGLAAVSYFILTGNPPVTGPEDYGEAAQQQDIVPPSRHVPKLSTKLDTVILTALNPDPDSRYHSISDFKNSFIKSITSEIDTNVELKVDKIDNIHTSETATSAGVKGELESNGSEFRITRREAVGMFGVGGFGMAGYIYPTLGGANNREIPDWLEYAFHSRTGTLLWYFNTDSVLGSPAISNGMVYVCSRDGEVLAFDSKYGTQEWSFETERDWVFGPTVAEDRVFIIDSNGLFSALNADTGKEQWRKQTEPRGSGSAPFTPVVVGDTVYAGTGYALALDAYDGTIIWTKDIEFPSIPQVTSATAYFGSGSGVHAFNTSTGQSQWLFETNNEVLSCAVTEDTLFGRTNNRIFAIDVREGTEQWMVNTDGADSGPVLGNGLIYVSIGDKIQALNTDNGRYEWEFDMSGSALHNPTFDDDTLYISSDNHIYAVDATKGTEQWSFTGTDWENIRSPTVFEDRLYLGTDKGRIYAISLDEPHLY